MQEFVPRFRNTGGTGALSRYTPTPDHQGDTMLAHQYCYPKVTPIVRHPGGDAAPAAGATPKATAAPRR